MSLGMRKYFYFTAAAAGAGDHGGGNSGTRMLAPYFGTSHFVWTGQIVMTLLALSCGYYLGGWLVDRSNNLSRLYACILVAAIYLCFTVMVVTPLSYLCLPAAGCGIAAGFAGSFFPAADASPWRHRFWCACYRCRWRWWAGRLGASRQSEHTRGVWRERFLDRLRSDPLHAGLGDHVSHRGMDGRGGGCLLLHMEEKIGQSGYRGHRCRRGAGGGRGRGGAGCGCAVCGSGAGVRANSNFGAASSHENQRRESHLSQRFSAPERLRSREETKHVCIHLPAARSGRRLWAGSWTTSCASACGIGVVPMQFASEGARVEAVEINPAVVTMAEKYFDFDQSKINLHIADGRQWLESAHRGISMRSSSMPFSAIAPRGI